MSTRRIVHFFHSHDAAQEQGCKACDRRRELSTPPITQFEHGTCPPTLWGSSSAEDSTHLAHTWPQQHRIQTRTCKHTASWQTCTNQTQPTSWRRHIHVRSVLLATRPTDTTAPTIPSIWKLTIPAILLTAAAGLPRAAAALRRAG